MNFARLAIAVLSITVSVLAPVSHAHADEGMMRIAQNKQEKQLIINFLRQRLDRHKAMSSAEILADLNSAADHNRRSLQVTHPDQAHNFDMVIAQESDKLKQLGDKDLIILMETARLQEAMSSDNYMLYIMNHGAPQLAWMVCTCGDPTISIVFAIFLVPFDIVLLPIEFLISAITGF
jgi:hypothetical protein